MNEDKILSMFFEPERWQNAISKGIDKDMNKATLYQLTTPEARLIMYERIKSGNYKIMPPHTAKIPKDNGDFRTVYVNEPVDRILLSIANDLLFELMPEMVHPRCTSYQKGIGCGRVVQDVSRIIYSAEGKIIGWKGDFSKYFDSVPIRFIDWAFDKVEEKCGKSALIDVIREYYHTDLYFDEDNNLCEKYQSLKQGCSVAAWLADVILYHLDDKLSKLNGYYVRYSDDTLFVGEDYEKAMDIMKSELEMMQMTLNPKKVEYLDANHWFKFLGYSIKGHNISLSSTRIKIFQKDKNGCNTKEYKHRCKGVPYVRLNNKDIFVADLMKKVYVPMYKIARDGFDTTNRRELYNLVKKFNKIRKHLAWETKQSDTFISAYKGAGSYFAMRNLIMFSDARFTGKSEAASLRKIDTDAAKYGADEEGWRMLGVLKQLIAESNISIDGKLCVWAEESAFRKAINEARNEYGK